MKICIMVRVLELIRATNLKYLSLKKSVSLSMSKQIWWTLVFEKRSKIPKDALVKWDLKNMKYNYVIKRVDNVPKTRWKYSMIWNWACMRWGPRPSMMYGQLQYQILIEMKGKEGLLFCINPNPFQALIGVFLNHNPLLPIQSYHGKQP